MFSKGCIVVADEWAGVYNPPPLGMWKRLTASVLEDVIATSICTTKWKRKRKRKRWKRH